MNASRNTIADVSAPKVTKRIEDSTPIALGNRNVGSFSIHSSENMHSFPSGTVDRFALNRRRTVNDFEVRALVGKGCYGIVFLVAEKGSSRFLAVKRMSKQVSSFCFFFFVRSLALVAHTSQSKKVLVDKNQVLTIMTEALVMKEATTGNNPWLVQV